MELNELYASLEAVLFAHADPISTDRLAEIHEAEPVLVERVLRSIKDDLAEQNRGLQLIQLEGSWQLATKSEYGDAVKRAMDHRRNMPLTSAALEVLAIIAYNQPVSRSFVDQVRGVDSSSPVSGLVEKGLVAEAGRLDLPGRPISYRTTDAFLRTFGISSLRELPALHAEEAQADESGLYGLPGGAASGDDDVEEEEVTRSIRGGGFIEGQGGAARLVGMEDEELD